TQECPHLAPLLLDESAPIEILEEARLVDRHQWTETHRHRRELPEIRHQPRMRIRRNPFAFAFLPIMDEPLLGEPSFDECARVDPRRHVPLRVDQIAAVVVRSPAPEMAEAAVVKPASPLQARNGTGP